MSRGLYILHSQREWQGTNFPFAHHLFSRAMNGSRCYQSGPVMFCTQLRFPSPASSAVWLQPSSRAHLEKLACSFLPLSDTRANQILLYTWAPASLPTAVLHILLRQWLNLLSSMKKSQSCPNCLYLARISGCSYSTQRLVKGGREIKQVRWDSLVFTNSNGRR